MSTDNKTYYHGYRFKLYPTEEQKKYIDRLISLYRFVYNWGIEQEQSQYKAKLEGKVDKGFHSFFTLCKLYAEFRDQPGNEWLKEIPNTTARLALRDVDQAYYRFFLRQNRHPKFKSRKHSLLSFHTRRDRFYIDRNKIKFEGLSSMKNNGNDTISLQFNTNFYRNQDIKYMNPTISKDKNGDYWVSFNVKEPIKPLTNFQTEPIGIDLGGRKTFTLSTGEVYIRPNEKVKKLEKRLKRAHRHYSRDINRRFAEAIRTRTKYDDIPVSKRSEKRAKKIRDLYAKITNVKENFYHNTIKQIVMRNPSAIVVETLHVQDMINTADKFVRSSMAKLDFAKIQNIIADKCEKYGVTLIKAADNYPSTQLCSSCGYKQDIGKRKIYRCPQCGMIMDRDVNAAINLVHLAY